MDKKLIIPKGSKYLDKAVDENEIPFFNENGGVPNGIIDKKYTGIGATTLELKANRSSILVLPFVNLAEEKSRLKEFDSHYCKAGFDFEQKLESYVNSDVEHKKLIIVADNLHKLRKVLGESVYKEYHVVIDEVEVLQLQSTLRVVLPLCIDEFLKYHSKSMISATPIKFRNPKIQALDHFVVEKLDHLKSELTFIKAADPSYNASKIIVEGIRRNKKSKYLIGCNSRYEILRLIAFLSFSNIGDVKVLASDYTLKRLDKKYRGELIDKKLPAQINICTSAYYAGFDIEDTYQLIGLSLDSAIHHTMSVESFVQLEGRERTGSITARYLIVINPFNFSSFEDIPTDQEIDDRFLSLKDVTKAVNGLTNSNDRHALIKSIKKTEFTNPASLLYENSSEELAVNHLIHDFLQFERDKKQSYQNDYKGFKSKLREWFRVDKEFNDDQVGPFIKLSRSLTLQQSLEHLQELIPDQPHTINQIAISDNYENKLRGLSSAYFLALHEYSDNYSKVNKYLTDLIAYYELDFKNINFLTFLKLVSVAINTYSTKLSDTLNIELDELNKPLTGEDIWTIFNKYFSNGKVKLTLGEKKYYNEVICLFKILFSYSKKGTKYVKGQGVLTYFQNFNVLMSSLNRKRDSGKFSLFGTRNISFKIGHIEIGPLMEKTGLMVFMEHYGYDFQ